MTFKSTLIITISSWFLKKLQKILKIRKRAYETRLICYTDFEIIIQEI